MTAKRRGRESCEFASFHPLVLAVYYFLVIGITMFSMAPLFLCASCLTAWIYMLLLKGRVFLKQNLIMALSVLLLMTVINTLFTHNGETVLFYINRNRGNAGGVCLWDMCVCNADFCDCVVRELSDSDVLGQADLSVWKNFAGIRHGDFHDLPVYSSSEDKI